MSDDLLPFLTKFNDAVKETGRFLSIARASKLQQDALEALGQLILEIAEEKARAIEVKNEDYANMLLGCECVAAALIAELKMWILLKQEEPDAAWDQLVSAQDAYIAAMRAHSGFSHLAFFHQRMEAIEQLVFPPQMFTSVALIVERQECSICGDEYEDCAHLIGKPYMGEFCSVIMGGNAKIHSVSIVENPADKRCRIQRFSGGGDSRNRMT